MTDSRLTLGPWVQNQRKQMDSYINVQIMDKVKKISKCGKN